MRARKASRLGADDFPSLGPSNGETGKEAKVPEHTITTLEDWQMRVESRRA
jgi:hypothetical protein